MKLYSKHGEQQTVIAKTDFTGGLNTAAQVDGIAENQLADVLNMEIDVATGKLRTVAGTSDIFDSENIFAAMYDSINNLILIVKNDKQVYFADFEGNISDSLGTLTGSLYPQSVAWENGLIIASGGNLQYFDGANLNLLLSSPFVCYDGENNQVTYKTTSAENVFVRDGRVCFSNGENIFYSAVGDENLYLDDTNRKDTAKWIEINSKDGGAIKAIVSLANDVLIIKDNKKVYRLAGNYPQWQLAEVASEIICSGRLSVCKVGDDVFVLGNDEVYLVQNNLYGTMRPENLALQIKSEVQRLPRNAKVKFIPSLWQVWILGKDGNVLVFDLRLKSWWKRKFNSEILDVFEVGEDVYLVKKNKISQLDKGTFTDDGEKLHWKFLSQRLVSHHEFLLKRSRVSITPLNPVHFSGNIFCGQVAIPLPIPDKTIKIQDNDDKIFDNATQISKEGRNRGYILPQPPDGIIFRNVEMIDDNRHKLFANDSFEIISRNVYRHKYLDVAGRGEGGRFILQSVIMDVAEV